MMHHARGADKTRRIIFWPFRLTRSYNKKMSLPKRRAVSKSSSNLAALQTLRRLRQEGGSRLQEYEV